MNAWVITSRVGRLQTVEGSVASLGGVGAKLIGNDPRKQFIDAIDGMLGDASDDVAEVGLGIKAIQFGGTNESVDCGPAFAAAVGAEVQIVLSAESDSTSSAFSCVVVDFHSSVIDV